MLSVCEMILPLFWLAEYAYVTLTLDDGYWYCVDAVTFVNNSEASLLFLK